MAMDKGHHEEGDKLYSVFAYRENYVGEEKVLDYKILGYNSMQHEKGQDAVM